MGQRMTQLIRSLQRSWTGISFLFIILMVTESQEMMTVCGGRLPHIIQKTHARELMPIGTGTTIGQKLEHPLTAAHKLTMDPKPFQRLRLGMCGTLSMPTRIISISTRPSTHTVS